MARPLVNRYSGVSDASAECDECGWHNQQRNALATASNHARATGHQVHAQQQITITYNRRDGVNHKYEWT